MATSSAVLQRALPAPLPTAPERPRRSSISSSHHQRRRPFTPLPFADTCADLGHIYDLFGGGWLQERKSADMRMIEQHRVASNCVPGTPATAIGLTDDAPDGCRARHPTAECGGADRGGWTRAAPKQALADFQSAGFWASLRGLRRKCRRRTLEAAEVAAAAQDARSDAKGPPYP